MLEFWEEGMGLVLILWICAAIQTGEASSRSTRSIYGKPKHDMLYYFYSGKLKELVKKREPTLTGWSAWGGWSSCTVRCNGGKESRARTCRTNVADGFAKYVTQQISFEQYLMLTPQCNGDAFEHRTCNEHTCGAEWTTWSSWAPCSLSCGWNGIQSRHRDCVTENAATTFNFLTSNLALDAYLEQYKKCPGVGKQTKKCGKKEKLKVTTTGVRRRVRATWPAGGRRSRFGEVLK